MTFDEYQKIALTTAKKTYDDPMIQNSIWAMGIAGEAGEVIEKWKKIMAYKNGRLEEEDIAELAKEMGDVIWYIAVLADSLGLSFEQIMQMNTKKLADRNQRGKIMGAGDNR